MKKFFIVFSVVLVGLTASSATLSTFAAAKAKTTKNVTAKKKAVPAPVAPQTPAVVTPAPEACPTVAPTPAPVVAAPTPVTNTTVIENTKMIETQKVFFDSRISLLRNYLKLRDEFFDYAFRVNTEKENYGKFALLWNSYYSPFIENYRSYANKQKADYLTYIISQDLTSLKTYLKKAKDGYPTSIQFNNEKQISTSSFDKNQLELYRAYLLEDFSKYTEYFTSRLQDPMRCKSYIRDEWQYVLKPRYDSYISIASSLGLSNEKEFMETYQKIIISSVKDTCERDLN